LLFPLNLKKTPNLVACISFTFLVVFSAAVSEATAASDAECTEYAKFAVAQNKTNKNLGCKFKGERWHKNRIAHFIFCKAVGSDLSGRETDNRASKLAQCRDALAADQNNENLLERERPEIVGEREDNIANELADGINNAPVRVCKATLTRAKDSSTGRTQRWRRRALINLWEAESQKRYGKAFSDYTNAKSKSIKCNPDLFDSQNFICKIRAKPCNN